MVTLPEPDPEPAVKVISFTHVGLVNGRLQFFAEGAPCFTLQFAYDLVNGPWYDEADGVEGQPVDVALPGPGQSQRFYRAVERPCPEPE